MHHNSFKLTYQVYPLSVKDFKNSLRQISIIGIRTHRTEEAYNMLPRITLSVVELLELGYFVHLRSKALQPLRLSGMALGP